MKSNQSLFTNLRALSRTFSSLLVLDILQKCQASGQ